MASKKYWASNSPFLLGIIIYGLALLAYYLNFYDYPVSNETGKWGEFGDFLGGLTNPLFTLITVLLFIKSLDQNKKAIEISSEELKLTREEMAHNKKLQKDTEEALRQQIDIAKTESHFNNARLFINEYSNRINELENEIYEFMMEDHEREKKYYEEYMELSSLKHKVDELKFFINGSYDDLISRLNERAESFTIQHLFYEDYEVKIKTITDFYYVVAFIKAPTQEEVKCLAWKHDKNNDIDLRTWRFQASMLGKDQAIKAIDFHKKTGFWYESDYNFHTQNK